MSSLFSVFTGRPLWLRRQLQLLAGLTLAVLLVHWAALRGAPMALASFQSDAPSAVVTRAFTTRTVNIRKAAPAAQTPKAPAPPKAASPPNSDQYSAQAPVESAQVAPDSVAPAPQPTLPGSSNPADNGQAVAAADEPPGATPSAQALQNYAIPGSVRLKYDIKGNIKGFAYFANGELLWLQDGKTYDARLEISHFLLGSRVQTSKGAITTLGLEPLRFGDKVRSEVAAHFERNKGKVSFSANTPDVPLLLGAQDHLSIFIQLAAMLGGDPDRFTEGVTVPFQAVGPRSSEWWVFKVGAAEALTLPGGSVKAVKLTRDPSGEYDSRVEVWLAPEMNFLPVRIRLSQPNGDFVEQLWSSTREP
jgi:hypothetical protein